MKHDKTCPKCHGRDVGYVHKPANYVTSMRFKGTGVASEQWVCPGCGYVEVYAVELEQDWPQTLDVYYGAPKQGPFR